MLGYVIAILVCTGNNCELVQPEPETSYPTYEACIVAATPRTAALNEFAEKRHPGGKATNLICLQPQQTIKEVEDPYDALDTVIVHTEPSAISGYVGVVEKGQRTLVTGEVSGTQWLRVLLRDGKTGFVYGDRLRKVGAVRNPAVASADTPQSAPSPTPTKPPPQPPLPAPLAVAPVTPPPTAPAAPQPRPQQQAAIVPQTPPTPPPAPHPAPAPPPAAPAATLAPLGKGEFRACDHCPVMATLSPGVLAMGSNEDPTEKPIHRVNIRSFAIGKYPVSVAEWSACVSAGGCSYAAPAADGDPTRTAMANLSFADATQYVQWLQKLTGKPYRIPTEAEWEYAARAGTTTRYWWGEQPGTGKADCEGCGAPHDPKKPQPMDAYPASPWGLYGMGGGVAQWVEDCWHLSYQGAPADGSAWRAPSCSHHVLRGGSWKNPPTEITVSNRNFYDTNVRYLANALRVAVSLP